jgi:hypothetical protein
VTDLNMALLAHWLVTRLGMALLIATVWPLLVGGALAATGSLDSLWLAFLGPLVAALYMINVRVPDVVFNEDDDDQDDITEVR